jgi:hypothetical protein
MSGEAAQLMPAGGGVEGAGPGDAAAGIYDETSARCKNCGWLLPREGLPQVCRICDAVRVPMRRLGTVEKLFLAVEYLRAARTDRGRGEISDDEWKRIMYEVVIGRTAHGSRFGMPNTATTEQIRRRVVELAADWRAEGCPI